jgi:formylglycine-generating enzyme required for sulfatase activity
MAGNVWNWVSDWYDPNYYAGSPASNPTGPTSGFYHVLRGGNWITDNIDCRSAFRDNAVATSFGITIGFRCVSTAPGL